jgi:hypothetical protein
VNSRNRKGVVLIVVVFLLSLIGVGTVFLTRQTAQLSVATRQVRQDSEIDNLYFSACAYIQANRQSLLRPDAPLNQSLTVEAIAFKPATVSLQMGPSGSSDRTILLTIQLQTTPKPIQRKWTIRLIDAIPTTIHGPQNNL